MEQWNGFTKRSPSARMICIDSQSDATTQGIEPEDIVNAGGFLS